MDHVNVLVELFWSKASIVLDIVRTVQVCVRNVNQGIAVKLVWEMLIRGMEDVDVLKDISKTKLQIVVRNVVQVVSYAHRKDVKLALRLWCWLLVPVNLDVRMVSGR